MRISLIENWPFLQFLKRYVWNPMVIKQNTSTSRLFWSQIIMPILYNLYYKAMPLIECWSSLELILCLKCSGALGFPCQESPCLSVPPLQGCFFPSWTMWRQCWKNSNASCLFLLTKALLLIQSISKNDSVDKIGCHRRLSLFWRSAIVWGAWHLFHEDSEIYRD